MPKVGTWGHWKKPALSRIHAWVNEVERIVNEESERENAEYIAKQEAGDAPSQSV